MIVELFNAGRPMPGAYAVALAAYAATGAVAVAYFLREWLAAVRAARDDMPADCEARQMADGQMRCIRCRYIWDADDTPPPCGKHRD